MLTGEQFTGIFVGRGLVSYHPIVNVVRYTCVCACACCMKFSLDDSIFPNLSCNFTVNNCMILFQVPKKPVMTITLLYSHIYLSCTVRLTSEASTKSQLCNMREERPLIHKIDPFILLWFLKNVDCQCYNDVMPCAHYTSLCRGMRIFYIVYS